MPDRRGGRLRADRAPGVGARRPRSPPSRHRADGARGGPGQRPPLPDVERRHRGLALPSGRRDRRLLPRRRGRRGLLRGRGLGNARDRVRLAAVPRARLRRRPTRHHLPVRARRDAADLARLPHPGRRSRRRTAIATATASCSSRRRSRSATSILRRARDPSRGRRLRAHRPGARRPAALPARLPPVRCRRLGRLRLPVRLQRARLRAPDRAAAPAAAGPPDLPGAQLRHLLVLPARARLRPGGGAASLPPLQPPVGGGHLLRLGRVRQPQGDRGRLGHRPPVGPSPWPAARPGRESTRHAPDGGAGGDVGHVPTPCG